MFGINTTAIKAAFQDFSQAASQLPPSTDPWIRLIVTLIQNLGKGFGVGLAQTRLRMATHREADQQITSGGVARLIEIVVTPYYKIKQLFTGRGQQ